MNWLEQYTNKRISKLKQQIIKQTWQKMNLEIDVNEIKTMQQDKEKAPSED